jgi:hypothetical protein
MYLVSFGIAFLLFAGIGAVIGAIIGLPAALVARSRYRAERATELAALAAERAAQRELIRDSAAIRKRNARGTMPWPLILLAVAALSLIVILPGLVAQWAYETLVHWQGLATALGALAAGGAALAISNRVGWLGYVFDWLGVAFLFGGALLGIGELTGYAVWLLEAPAFLVYMGRLSNRLVSKHLLAPAERPERPPVLFRYDGETIVIYPSRRKLGLHAVFAGGVVLIASSLAVLLRDAGPTPVVALGVFAVGGVIGFIPDVAQLLVRRPALIINHDGITDQASAGVMGFGLIPWHEIAGAFNAGKLRGSVFQELAIVPVSFKRLVSRQPLLKRPFLRLVSAMGGGMIFVGSLFLSQPPSEAARCINDYVKSHAPAGYAETDEEPDERERHGDADPSE